MEQWKEIEGYEGLYWVSDQGRVKNRYGRILKLSIDKYGYYQIKLYKYNKFKTFKVHRLVALAFIPNSDPQKNQVNHKSEIKTDNKVNNIEWCTAKYNTNYGTRNERIGRKVKCIESGEIFKTAAEAARYYNCDRHTIARSAFNNQTLSNGLTWQYID